MIQWIGFLPDSDCVVKKGLKKYLTCIRKYRSTTECPKTYKRGPRSHEQSNEQVQAHLGIDLKPDRQKELKDDTFRPRQFFGLYGRISGLGLRQPQVDGWSSAYASR